MDNFRGRTLGILIAALAMAGSMTAQRATGPQYRPSVVVQLGVSDLDASIRFYENVLGFRCVERRADLQFAHIETNVPGLQLGLSASSKQQGTGAAVINISVANIEAARRMLESRGVVFNGPTQAIPGKVALAAFKDPDGNQLRFAGPPPAQEPTADPALGGQEQQQARAAIDRARAVVTAFKNGNGIPGLQVAVASKGRLRWSEGMGLADLEQSVPVSTATRFRIGSVSKVLTAAALMRLHEAGRIDLDADVRRYVPHFARDAAPITIRQLAGHLSGIRNYTGSEFFSQAPFDDVLAAVRVFADDPLLFEPGAKYAYTTYNYTLLSAAIQQAADEPFLQHMERSIFKPLGMNGTTADAWKAIVPNRSRAYVKNRAGTIEHAGFVDVSNKWAGGGFLSTAEDLIAFSLAHLTRGLMSDASIQTMFTTQSTTSGSATGVGIGWRVTGDAGVLRYVHHGGDALGARAFVLLEPRTQSAVVLLVNLGGAPIGEKEALAVLAPFIEPEPAVHPRRAPSIPTETVPRSN